MEWRQIGKLADLFDDFVINQGRGVVGFAAMNDAMADGLDLL